MFSTNFFKITLTYNKQVATCGRHHLQPPYGGGRTIRSSDRGHQINPPPPCIANCWPPFCLAHRWSPFDLAYLSQSYLKSFVIFDHCFPSSSTILHCLLSLQVDLCHLQTIIYSRLWSSSTPDHR